METQMVGTLMGVALIIYILIAIIFVTSKNSKDEER